MKKKSLIETNPYLKDPKALQAAITRHAVSSFAIEGVRVQRSEPQKSNRKQGSISKKP